MVPWTSEEPYVRECGDATTRGLLMGGLVVVGLGFDMLFYPPIDRYRNRITLF